MRETSARPATNETAARPPTNETAARPGTIETAARPATSETSARPGTSETAARPLTDTTPTSDPRLVRLQDELRRLGDVVVAFSGGADSALLAKVAHDVLGPGRARAVTAVSPSLAPEERDDCAALASEWGLNWTAVITDELADPAYAANDGSRCYHCKATLMDALAPDEGADESANDGANGSAKNSADDGANDAAAGTAGPTAARNAATVVLGVNLDDLAEHRPGQQAARERGARFPFVDAGLTKTDVRDLSRRLGLRTWNKPAAACLASRVPYGTPVTLSVLDEVARAESGLRRLGFVDLRVRHYGELARIEVPLAAMADVVARRVEVVDAVRSAGYRYVTLDLEGLRSGNLNHALEVTR